MVHITTDRPASYYAWIDAHHGFGPLCILMGKDKEGNTRDGTDSTPDGDPFESLHGTVIVSHSAEYITESST